MTWDTDEQLLRALWSTDQRGKPVVRVVLEEPCPTCGQDVEWCPKPPRSPEFWVNIGAFVAVLLILVVAGVALSL